MSLPFFAPNQDATIQRECQLIEDAVAVLTDDTLTIRQTYNALLAVIRDYDIYARSMN